MSSPLARVVASSVAIARHAGGVICSIMQTGNLDIVNKGDGTSNFDPQTLADRKAQSIIIGSLEKQHPGLKVIGEEDDVEADTEDLVMEMDAEVLQNANNLSQEMNSINIQDLVVWVDPLDGTKEFTEGNVTHVTVLIGISHAGRPLAGVIHQPFATPARTIWGIVGLGQFGIPPSSRSDGLRIVTTTKSHSSENVILSLEAIKADQVIRTGGAGYKVLQLLEGVADAYIFPTPGCKKWDTCAPEAILRACGGRLSDALGEDIDYADTTPRAFTNWTGVIATRGAPEDHTYYLDRIPEGVRKNLKELRAEKLA